MGCVFWLPSSGSAPVSPTPSAAVWTLHVNSVSRPLNKINGGSALATLAYDPDAVDHLVDGNSMCAQFVSEILPPQTILAQNVGFGARALEVAASNNLFPIFRLYCVNVGGSTVLATLLAGTREGTELAIALTGAAYVRAISAVTLNEPFRLVLEVGAGGLPVNTATDTHNHSWAFGETLATGGMNLPQNGDTTACPALLIFEDGVTFLPLGEAVLAIGI